MSLQWVRARAVVLAFSVVLFGCGGTDPNLVQGYWRVAQVETQSLSGLQRSETWQVDPATAYVLSFRNNQYSVPYAGAGMQQFQLPPQGGAFQMEDERIVLATSQNALELREIDEQSMVLAQVVNDPQMGNMEVQQRFEKVDEHTLRQLLMANGMPLPPELANGASGMPMGYPQGYPGGNPGSSPGYPMGTPTGPGPTVAPQGLNPGMAPAGYPNGYMPGYPGAPGAAGAAGVPGAQAGVPMGRNNPYPANNPGVNPSANPGMNPAIGPGVNPGFNPNQIPGQAPAVNPGQIPANPNLIPGQVPAGYPQTAPGQNGFNGPANAGRPQAGLPAPRGMTPQPGAPTMVPSNVPSPVGGALQAGPR